MFNFLFKSWLLSSVFGSSLEKQARQYDQLVQEHYDQMDNQVQIFIEVIEEYQDADQCIINCLVDNLDFYGLDGINYMLAGLYQVFPEHAKNIKMLLNEILLMP